MKLDDQLAVDNGSLARHSLTVGSNLNVCFKPLGWFGRSRTTPGVFGTDHFGDG
jgi:hypothetical protein